LEGVSVTAWTELLKRHTTAFSNMLLTGSLSVILPHEHAGLTMLITSKQ